MKRFYLLFLIIICCKEKEQHSVIPFITNINVKFIDFKVPDGETFYLKQILPDRSYVVLDSSKCKNNLLNFRTNTKEDFLGIIERKDNTTSPMIAVTNDLIQIDWHKLKQNKITSKVTGGENDFFLKTQLIYVYPYDREDEVRMQIAKYGTVQLTNKNYAHWIKYEQQFYNWINDNKDKYCTIFKLFDNRNNLATKSLENCLKILKNNFEKHSTYIELQSYLKIRKAFQIGQKFINFEVQNKNLKILNSNTIFDNNKEIYIVDFGASWCKYCILQAREINNIFSKIDTTKIQIISLSIDKNKEDWLKYVEKENYSWKSYLISNNINNSGIKSIVSIVPAYFVLDNNRKIIEKYNSLNEIYFLKIK